MCENQHLIKTVVNLGIYTIYHFYWDFRFCIPVCLASTMHFYGLLLCFFDNLGTEEFIPDLSKRLLHFEKSCDLSEFHPYLPLLLGFSFLQAQRLSSFGDDFIGNDFSIEPVDGHTTIQSPTLENVSESMFIMAFDRSSLPSSFEFQSIVEGYTQFERAACFGRLLSMASNSEFEVKQDEAFGRIFCEAILSV